MNSPMTEIFRMTVEHYLVTDKGERIKVDDSKGYEFEVQGHAIHEAMHLIERKLTSELKE